MEQAKLEGGVRVQSRRIISKEYINTPLSPISFIALQPLPCCSGSRVGLLKDPNLTRLFL